jgi:hypothetical protein
MSTTPSAGPNDASYFKSGKKRGGAPNQQQQELPATKRPYTIPPVEDGVVAASKSPISDRSFDVLFKELKDSSTFFSGTVSASYEASRDVRNTLKSTGASDAALRNAVYTYLLQDEGILFPASATGGNDSRFVRALRRISLMRRKKYNESSLANLFVEFSKTHYSPDAGNENIPRVMQGLPVTTTSFPDMAILKKSPEADKTQLVLGEFKNGSNYNQKAARVQCVMYLVALLYWLRVELGEPIEAVYGFYFCGQQCNDQDGTYAVGLIKLLAPTFLGERLMAETFWTKAKTDKLEPMCLLVHFLKHGNHWQLSGDRVEKGRQRIPALFTLPTSLWKNDSEHGRELVLNGTYSIVFRFTTGNNLTNLLMRSGHFASLQEELPWVEFLARVTEFFAAEKADDQTNTGYYLKVFSKDTCRQSDPLNPMTRAWLALDSKKKDNPICTSILSPYCVRPYGDPDFGVVVMRNCGKPLLDLPKRSIYRKDILPEFQKIIDIAMFLSNHLPHGDVLPHNIVYHIDDEDKMTLTLIDVDEGVVVGYPLLYRRSDYETAHIEGADDWYTALYYPNYLRANAQSYTQSQLLALFQFVVGIIRDFPVDNTKYVTLKADIQQVGEYLFTMDKPHDTAHPNSEVHTKLGAVYESMCKIVKDLCQVSSPA